jgi:hypothetical protein
MECQKMGVFQPVGVLFLAVSRGHGKKKSGKSEIFFKKALRAFRGWLCSPLPAETSWMRARRNRRLRCKEQSVF